MECPCIYIEYSSTKRIFILYFFKHGIHKQFFSVKLLEDDVPGAKLSHDNIHDCSVMQLKRWLECRNLQVSGNKTTLVERYFKHLFIL